MAARPQDVERKLPSREEASEKLEALVGKLEREADNRVGKRTVIEQRWLDDLRQYHGQYPSDIEQDLKDNKKSTLFINETRPKTNAMEARLSDMLFPTDDRNWGVLPTPVPELTVAAEEAANEALQANLVAAENENDPMAQANAQDADFASAQIQARIDEAKKRARSMEEEIDDHLRECKYPSQSREVIKDGCKIGTGVLKGPVTDGTYKRSWKAPEQQAPEQQAEQQQNAAYQLVYGSSERPMFWRVDPWNFFPDMDATSMEDCDGVFERHLLTRSQMRRLARLPDFDEDAIRQIIREKALSSAPTYLSQLRSISVSYGDLQNDRYHVWEYHGTIEPEDFESLAVMLDDPDMLADVEIDPLQELNVILWFCQGKLLKFGIQQLDSGDPVYSVFNLEKDEASLFGFGIPYLMRDPQKAVGGGWRTLMDNMGLSSGPQIVINKQVVEPADGKWEFVPRKIWFRKATAVSDRQKPFETFNIESHAQDLLAIIDRAEQNIDRETAMPMLAQGEQGSQVTKTFQGMAILMNAVNVVFRRIVKNWDDDVTTPSITRQYDWLMQFSPKEHIKGDYQVDARGSTVLLVREMQSQNLMVFISSFVGHPVLGRFLKEEGLPAFRRLSQALMIPADEIIKSDQELKKDKAEAARQPPQPDPEMEKVAAQMEVARIKIDGDMQIEGMRRETALIQFAAQANLKLDELRAMLEDKREDRASKERILATEVAVEERQARRGDDKGGSGGYIS